MAVDDVPTRSDATRSLILDTAFEAFAEAGDRAASIRDIAARAGISHPTLLYHFPSKAHLLMEVLARRDERDCEDDGFHDLAPRAMLRHLVDGARLNATRRGIVELFAQLSAEASDPSHPAHGYFAARYETLRADLTGAFTGLQSEGVLRPGLAPRVAAAQVVAVMDGLQVQWLIDEASVDMAEALEQFLLGLVDRDADLFV